MANIEPAANEAPIEAAPTVRREINWGGIVKGAVIVSAVVLAAVAGVLAFEAGIPWLTSAIQGNSVLGPIAGGIESGIAWIGDSISSLVTSATPTVANAVGTSGAYLSSWGTSLMETLGLTETISTGAVTAINNAAPVIGGATAVALAAKPAIASLHQIPATTTVVVPPPPPPPPMPEPSGLDTATAAKSHAGAQADINAALASKTAAANATNAAGHHVNDLAHHAAEGQHEKAKAADKASGGWMDRFSPKSANGSFADAALRSKSEREITPRDANFAAQLDADRANLDAALAK